MPQCEKLLSVNFKELVKVPDLVVTVVESAMRVGQQRMRVLDLGGGGSGGRGFRSTRLVLPADRLLRRLLRSRAQVSQLTLHLSHLHLQPPVVPL